MINVRMPHKEVQKLTPKITVVGVGGAGGNAVNNMISAGLQGVEFLVCNTDAQALEGSLCANKIQLGAEMTGGLGAGARPEVGRGAAEESLDSVMHYLEGSNMAFITAGMGGGTGTGAAPVIAKACREKGILTVGVVTKPFHFEGTLRMKMADAGIEEMQHYVDTLIVIPNQNLFRVANEKTTFADAFKMADGVLQSGVRGVTDLMVMPGLINLDFADIRSAMLEMGKAMMGTGEAMGDRRAIEAAESAINNPLLDDVTMKGARGVIINVTGGYDMTLFEVDEACNRIRDEVDPNANIIFGSTFDEAMEGIMRVSVVATGIDVVEQKARGKGPGYTTINTLTAQQQERRIERVQPHAESTMAVAAQAVAEPAPVAVTPSVAASLRTPPAMMGLPLGVRPAAVMAATPSPMAVYASAAAAARKIEEQPETAAYVQSDMIVDAEKKAETVATGGLSLRGTVYGDSFIPPQPVDPAMRASEYGPAGLSALRKAEEVPVQTMAASAGLSLRPPVPGASAQQKKRTPSLFERFTNQLLHHGESQADESEEGSVSGGGDAGGLSVKASTPRLTQGSLNIDAPKKDSFDDELDIPAFLRRQAN